jgi:hypothetical protein
MEFDEKVLNRTERARTENDAHEFAEASGVKAEGSRRQGYKLWYDSTRDSHWGVQLAGKH